MKSSLSLEERFRKPKRIGNSKINTEQMLPPAAGSWIELCFDMKLMKKGSVIGLIFAEFIHLLFNL